MFNDDGQLTMTDVVVRGNDAGGDEGSSVAGGLATWNGGTTTLSDCTISGNAISGGGSGCAAASTMELTDTLIMTDCTISNNSGPSIGGGLDNAGKATLTDVTISGNSATRRRRRPAQFRHARDGRLHRQRQFGRLRRRRDRLPGRRHHALQLHDQRQLRRWRQPLTGSGGGVLDFGATLTLTNCTFSGNSASGNGGGLGNGNSGLWSSRGLEQPPRVPRRVNDEQSTTSLTNCTVSGNTAYDIGGGVANYGTLSLTNTIVAGNNGGDFVSGSYTGSNNLIGGNPLLSPLGDYGGPTATMALLPGSPAIGGGTSDRRPELRPARAATLGQRRHRRLSEPGLHDHTRRRQQPSVDSGQSAVPRSRWSLP